MYRDSTGRRCAIRTAGLVCIFSVTTMLLHPQRSSADQRTRELFVKRAEMVTAVPARAFLRAAPMEREPNQEIQRPHGEPDHSEGKVGVERGKTIFLDYCSFCHELSGPDDSTATGLLRLATRQPFREEELRIIVEHPPPGMVKVPLGSDQLAALMAYLMGMPQQMLITPNGRP